MPVKPEVRSLLTALEAIETVPMQEQTPEGLRQAYARLAGLGVPIEMASVTDRVIPGPEGDLPIRIYRPHGLGGTGDDGSEPPPAPVVVWFHGGGWVIGSVDTHDTTVRALAEAAGTVVVSVEYRLAPEHPFPAGLEDALSAVRWVADNAAELGVDASRLAVAGDSAGGNLAAVICQQLRDSGPVIAFQLLVYPATDARMVSPSIAENAEGYFLTAEAMEWFLAHYLGGGDRSDPRVSPLLAPDEALVGLPPGLIITAEFDPLRDEGEAYGRRLQEAGVDMTVSRYDGVIHGFFSMRELIPDGGAAIEEAGKALRRALMEV